MIVPTTTFLCFRVRQANLCLRFGNSRYKVKQRGERDGRCSGTVELMDSDSDRQVWYARAQGTTLSTLYLMLYHSFHSLLIKRAMVTIVLRAAR